MAQRSQHYEWLSLVDTSGPPLAPAVLEEAFPQSLEKVPTPLKQRIRAAYDEWDQAVEEEDLELDELHPAWTHMVLTELLEYEDQVLLGRSDLEESLSYTAHDQRTAYRPDYVVKANDEYRMLVSIYPPHTQLDKPLPKDAWPASPAERMTALCRTSKIPLGLVTNGEQWMLVSAPADGTSGYTTWHARLWWQEPITFRAFVSLLGVRRCFGPREECLDKLLERSLEHQEEVTDTLGAQVRRAVEVLIQALGRADQDRDGELLKDIDPKQLYEAGLTVMMRLVFTLCAEERDLLLLGDPVYDENYAISNIRSQLREEADLYGEEVLEKRFDAWSRLLTVFRMIYGGVQHESLRLPALGGSLFDPDRFPFLEGRATGSHWREDPAVPLPIDNRTVLLLMRALQVLEQTGGAQLLSYSGLDVEQIGHVYEGLLEYTVKRVDELTISLTGTKNCPNPTITLAELEAETADKLAQTLKELTGRSLPALKKALKAEPDEKILPYLVSACEGDAALAKRLLPYASLMRRDSWDQLMIYPVGSFAVVSGSGRRETGTHYTPKSLTEPIVRYTLEPLVYTGPAEGHAEDEWQLKSPAELLELKICDMACGSGAFLVEVVRYMGQRLVEAWAKAEERDQQITFHGEVVDSGDKHELLPQAADERIIIARRLIAQSCIYGVDINPLAVELAKLSIWLITLAKHKPFGFLDHALRSGDSLVGLHDIEQLRHYRLKPEEDDTVLFKGLLDEAVEEVVALRLKLEDMPANTVADVEAQEKLLAEAQEKSARLGCAADLLVAAEFWGENKSDKKDRVERALDTSLEHLESGTAEEFRTLADESRQGQRMFHWPLEFPEVMVKRGGFDAFVGNPPYLGGKRIGTELGETYAIGIRTLVLSEKGSADLCAYFLRRGFDMLCPCGHAGMLLTNTIAQGDTRVLGPAAVVSRGGYITLAFPDTRWPGTANVTVSVLGVTKQTRYGNKRLDGRKVESISSFLTEGNTFSTPYKLVRHPALASIGTYLNGEGFVLSPEERAELLAANEHNAEVIAPYLVADDLNSRPDQSPSRYVINFGEMDERSASQFAEPFERLVRLVKPARDKITRQIHETCFWKHWDKRPELYKLLSKLDKVLVGGRVTKHVTVSLLPTDYLFSDRLIVVVSDRLDLFAVMQSTIHSSWVEQLQTSMGKTIGYAVSKCFSTFVWPCGLEASDKNVTLIAVGNQVSVMRENVLRVRNIGLTSIYNMLHSRDESSSDIKRLRELHVEMDQAVAAAYGWDDLDLDHGFHETKQGVRYTISEPARREVLQRLLKLNHERYAEEVAQGLHDKKKKTKKKPTGKKKATRKAKKKDERAVDLF